MGSSSSYLKLKVNEHVASFVYIYEPAGICYQRTISCHPDNKMNKFKCQKKSYYDNYSGDYYYFDGDFKRLDEILRDFNPDKTSVTYLVNRLKCEVDMVQYKNLWVKINEWKDYILDLPGGVIVGTFKPLLTYFGYGQAEQPKLIEY